MVLQKRGGSQLLLRRKNCLENKSSINIKH